MLIGLALILFCCSVLITARLRRTRIERNAAMTRLEHQAYHDALTDLPNRVLLHTRLEAADSATLLDRCANGPTGDGSRSLQRGQRHARTSRRGCAAASGRRAIGSSRAYRRHGRPPGRRRVRRPPARHDQEPAHVRRRESGARAGSTVHHGGPQPIDIGASIGIALVPDHGDDADTLLRRADVAMYVAKREQSGLIAVHTEQDGTAPSASACAADLRRAIEHGELVLHYQPKVDVQPGELVGFEALVRWPHPERGLVPPDEFIPLAEQTGLIRPLSRWAVRRRWRSAPTGRDAGWQSPWR